jgi:thymidine phosphorylase
MTSSGTLFFVVGPSGAGKDTLIDGARAALIEDGRFLFATRTITRPSGAAGEEHVGVCEDAFGTLEESGQFLLTWRAHGLCYGLPRTLRDALDQGLNVIANGSRAMVAALRDAVPHLVVVEVSAPLHLLAERIAARGRESAAEIEARLERTVASYPDGVTLIRVMNDSTASAGAARLLDAIMSHAQDTQPAPWGHLPSWRVYLDKLSGKRIEIDGAILLLDDLAAERYPAEQSAVMLRVLIGNLHDAEVSAIAKARTRIMPRIQWDAPMVVDKHSIGGIPGSRITLIVVPIIAAYGLLMPKTSSRAITSAAGTADAMEAAARVDLSAAEMREAVMAANGCIVWNGHLNHSPVDDVMNAMVRPLGLDSNRWSVASILSKKYSAGATHVIVDLPYGPQAKIKTHAQARHLGDLFESVGRDLGMTVKALATDGSGPIGAGIGPALELRDVLSVLDMRPTAPTDLVNKALFFAGQILSWAPGVGSEADGRAAALEILQSGRARQAFERIVDAQGRKVFAQPALLTRNILAPAAGTVTHIDGWVISGIAREAGAPLHAGAGIDLSCALGKTVQEGELLFRIHAEDAQALSRAYAQACADNGITLH